MGKNKILYLDVAPEAKRESTHIMSVLPFCNLDDLKRETISVPKTATAEPRYWKLDGSFDLFPDNPTGQTWGAWSDVKCGNDGVFAAPPVLTVEFSKLQSSVGLTFTFDLNDLCWCSELHIQWYRSGSEVTHATYYPNAVEYACLLEVRLYDKIVVTFRKLTKACRTLKLFSILYGIKRVFNHDEIKDGKVYLKTSLLSDALEISTFNFNLIASEAVPFLYQERQSLYAYNGDNLISTFFISTAKRTGDHNWQLKTQNLIGMLDSAEHQGGMYAGQTAAAVVAEVMGTYPYTLDASLQGVPVYGWLPYATKRENLQQLCFAIGGTVDTANSDRIVIRPRPSSTSRVFATTTLYQGGSVETSKVVTALNVTEHNYIQGTETAKVFEGTIAAEVKVVFDEPYFSLEIIGGTITESGANYAVINGTGAVELTGTKYEHITRIITKRNPDVSATDKQNICEVTAAYLVTPENSAAITERVYNYLMLYSKIKQAIIWSGERPGEKVGTTTSFSGDYSGLIESLSLTLGNTVKADVVIVGVEKSAATAETPCVNEFYSGDVV